MDIGVLKERDGLTAIEGIGATEAELLARVGVRTADELARANSHELYQRILGVTRGWEAAPLLPSPAQLSGWILNANLVPYLGG